MQFKTAMILFSVEKIYTQFISDKLKFLNLMKGIAKNIKMTDIEISYLRDFSMSVNVS